MEGQFYQALEELKFSPTSEVNFLKFGVEGQRTKFVKVYLLVPS